MTDTLASGDIIDNVFYIGYDAKIVLIPEPATLLLLGLGAVMLIRKREVLLPTQGKQPALKGGRLTKKVLAKQAGGC